MMNPIWIVQVMTIMDNLHFISTPGKAPCKEVDVLIVTGDYYIDHPSFGSAVIARVLDNAGYNVAVLSQPEYFDADSLQNLPEVRLFVGITSGNMDSIVSNYTGQRNHRKKDVFSTEGNPFFQNGKKKRPDRALIPYTSYIKQRYKKTPIVLGGVEASLRRFVHYDYVQQKLRNSVLVDTKADIIVYGMGERAIIEIAKRCGEGRELSGVPGTVIVVTGECLPNGVISLNDLSELQTDNKKLMTNTLIIEENMHHKYAKPIAQKHNNKYVLSFPPASPLSTSELDDVYSLGYQLNYPADCYTVPAWQMINSSVTSHRGCYGRCSFCAITSHQGPVVISRSLKSIKQEILRLTDESFFKGTITDVGGPTANMYATDCKIGWCKNPNCLFPEVCDNLLIKKMDYLKLLQHLKALPKVKNLFVSSGLRHDLALLKEEETIWIINNATSGHFKTAPEHVNDRVLKYMKKPASEKFEAFIRLFENNKQNKKVFILPYFILSHPGSDLQSARELLKFIKKHKISTHQYQDFTPTPLTISTAMYYGQCDTNGEKIIVPRFSSKNNPQRSILEDN